MVVAHIRLRGRIDSALSCRSVTETSSSDGSPSTTTPTVGFLGPRGTFTEQALQTQPDLALGNLITLSTMPDVLFAVEDNTLDLGFVAIENAIEGTVNATVDTLAFDVDLHIQREVIIPIQMCLLGRPGASVEGVRQVLTFSHASAQCRQWLRANVPGAEIVMARSTAEGAEMVAASDDPSVAAIANSLAATTYGLDILAMDIEDHSENSTRFVVVGRDHIPAPTGHDKTSIVVYQKADRPGSLLSILQEFAARTINLTLLLSRPTKTALGEYCFLLDMEGHVSDPIVGDCLKALHATQGGVKFLGSYPSAADGASDARRAVNADQAAAAAWLDGLRANVAP